MIFKSNFPDITIPEVSLPDFVLHRAQELGDKPALIDGPSGRTLTYKQLAGAVEKAAAGLAARGFKKGDVFAIYSPNVPEYAVAFLAVAALGGINTTINPLYTAGELAGQLNDCQAKFLLTVPPFMDKAREAAQEAHVQEIFVFGEAEGATPFAVLLQSEGQVPPVPIDPRRDLIVLPYSSGTTGLPKGVMLTHHNLVANICQFKDIETYGEADTLIGILPFFHIYGMTVIMGAALHKGATIVTMPRFDLEQFLQTMQNYGVTWAYLAPPIVLALAKHPLVDKYDLSKLKSILSGAAPLGKDVTQACATRLNCLVRQGYGLTETSPVTHFTPNDPARIKDGSIGPLVAATECRIIDYNTDAELGPNQEGELWIRGPQVMQGYLNRPDATRAVIDPDGWFRTGDIGYADEDGYFYIVDRLKELIKYKGLQVAPAELEAVLLSHPAVADAAVIPSPDEEAGEVPKAFVVLRGEAAPDELMAFVAERVAPYKRIRRLETIDQIPKSASGKILRRLLVEKERSK
ncbi:MAG: 4-coumarate--CoA ligase family protein [Anaerolineae bacterium]|nr:4-coumarate--CoA ligase family protein [Anaerolineales bacterium]MCQ3976452.1 4-coumarate--CoA ligase family protein [Anaerolineae bacterium]